VLHTQAESAPTGYAGQSCGLTELREKFTGSACGAVSGLTREGCKIKRTSCV